MKRLVDVLAASAGLLLLSPLLLTLAAWVRLSSGSPVLFRQQRVGRGMRNFTLVKFRTMSVAPGTERGSFDAGRTTRVTPVGRFLRRTKLDELPQLWNVLVGDMSLVGPRPEIRRWVEVYPERWARVLAVRPGITDPASILYRNEEELLSAASDPQPVYREDILPHKLAIYETYVRNHSLVGDMVILWRTLIAVLRR